MRGRGSRPSYSICWGDELLLSVVTHGVLGLPVPGVAAHFIQTELSFPAQNVSALLGTCIDHTQIARAALGNLIGNSLTGNTLKSLHHVQHAVAGTSTQIEDALALVVLHIINSSNMAPGQIHNVDEVADTGTVVGIIVITEDAQILATTDGGLIRTGYHAELDELRSAAANGKSWVAELQAKEQERTGIKSLKVNYNKVFGYFIEVTKSNLSLVPDNYLRKQTMANGERFITPELKEMESKILGAEDKAKALEAQLFEELRLFAQTFTGTIQSAAKAIAELDVLCALAECAAKYNYCRPRVQDDDVLRIIGGRHPVIEPKMDTERFVPNDTCLDGDNNRMMIITGPNMAGKSTYIRQTALLVIMAQMGSFIPADEAQIGIADRIFTRVGAMDDIARGQSTFMVEMLETANILNHATSRSIVILDEIGRGTSTFDGLSIAWAVAEYLLEHPVCRTQFATHYHELTELALTRKGVKNYNVAVREYGDQIVFLRQIVPGAADKSYGIHVAKLAGLPVEVITRAREILENLENNAIGEAGLPAIMLAREVGPAVHYDAQDGKAKTRRKTVKQGKADNDSDDDAFLQLSLFD